MALTDNIGVVKPNQMLVEVVIAQFKVLIKRINHLDKTIKLAYKTQCDNAIFDGLLSAGPQLAPKKNEFKHHVTRFKYSL